MSTSAPNSDPYILSRNLHATHRLLAQHYLWNLELGYDLHPSIRLPPNARIADVATGTASWILSLSRLHPTAHFTGFDISLSQAPPPAWLPPNMSVQEWDMYTPPPAEHLGKYDVVHIRLVGVVVKAEDVNVVVRNLSHMLKEGGCLQWDEIDVSDSVIVHVEDDVKEEGDVRGIGAETGVVGTGGKMKGKVEWVRKMEGLMRGHGAPKWILRLPDSFESVAGLVDTRMYRVKPERSLLRFSTDVVVGSWAEIVEMLPEGSEKKKEFGELLGGILEETKRGAGFGVAKVVSVGRKKGEE